MGGNSLMSLFRVDVCNELGLMRVELDFRKVVALSIFAISINY